MDRREALGSLGAAALGLVVPGSSQADHGDEMKGAPPTRLHAYLCAYHLAKKDPNIIIEAHHYCAPVNDEVHQCIIYDTAGPGARILGVEYIISDRLYQGLPDSEKKYYHPHTYEVIGGLLIAPGMPAEAEKKFMAGLTTTWGKTWHTWPDPKAPLPMGEPMLMWSAGADGQISAAELAKRDQKFHVSTEEIRKRRSYLGPVPHVPPPKSMDELGRQR